MQIINTVLQPQNRPDGRDRSCGALIAVLVSGAKSFSTAHAQDVQSSWGGDLALTLQNKTIYLPLVVSVQPDATPRDPVPPAPALVPTLVPTDTNSCDTKPRRSRS